MQSPIESTKTWSHVCLYSFSAGIVLLEKTALVLCFIQYLCTGQELLSWLTGALCLPLAAVQLLSLRWYITVGEKPKPSLIVLHCLHLGLFHRLWRCMRSGGEEMKYEASLMQQAEASLLCLIEALTFSLPQSLLHCYSLFTLQPVLLSPALLSVGLCLLNVSWFLVLFSRSCVLLHPGHLCMTAAALLCLFVWRAGMLGARVASLMFFCSTYHWWICGVFGVIHIFIFLNVKDGPSRYRMIGFYLLMLVENTFLLLLASDSFSGFSWQSLSVPVLILCSFVTGVIFVVLYYRFLHPKSTEILQSLRLQMSLTAVETTDADYKDSAFEPSTHGTFSVTGFPLEKPVQPPEGVPHHHQLMIHLALKTGNPDKINCIFGDRGILVVLHGDKTPEEASEINQCNQASVEEGKPSGKSPAESREGASGAETRDLVYNTCPAECSSTVYFSAEAQSSYNVTDSDFEKEKIPSLSPILDGEAMHWTGKMHLDRNQCYTSTPIAEFKTAAGSSPRRGLGWARRQVHF